jgi:hypothetical protein
MAAGGIECATGATLSGAASGGVEKGATLAAGAGGSICAG